MKNFKNLLKFMEGYKFIYLLGMLSILVSQVLTTITPLVLRTTVDSIIGNDPIKSPRIMNLVRLLGGKKSLNQIYGLSGFCLYL